MTALSFDGKGINGPDEYRSRLATFANDAAAQQYGPVFAAAPDLLATLQNIAACDIPGDDVEVSDADIWEAAVTSVQLARTAVEKATTA